MLMVLSQTSVPLTPSGKGCFVADDRTAGWKQAAIPAGAPALAAPDGFDQFRSGERVWMVHGPSAIATIGTRSSWGRMEYEFTVPTDTQQLTVRFAQRLEGMRVEVKGAGGWSRDVPLVAERRYAGDTLAVEWATKGVDRVTVVLHHHVRDVPVVADWSSAGWETMPGQGRPPVLAWHQPAGSRVELCDAPGRTLKLHAEALR